MALTIRQTGYSDYLDGSGNIKMLVIGGPDAGKTRSSSYWPKPFFLDCENSRGSLADRKMPYVEVTNSKDALDALTYLKGLERIPKKERQYQTIVLDTLDAFQRSVKDEWLQDTKAGAFSGYDAWGYLDSKMTMLMTRLLNLDFNVLVLCHYKDKTLKDKDGNESNQLMLQLQGDIKDTAFNDFALVGWLGSYWETEGDQGRVEKRGLTFTKTPDRPFLKDRFAILPKWVPIAFTDTDYQQIYDAFLGKLDERQLADSVVVGEVPDANPEDAAATQINMSNVVAPLIGGPVPPQEPSVLAVEDMSKPQLLETVQAEGVKVKGNALKAELIKAINEHRANPPEPAAVAAEMAEVAKTQGETVDKTTGELTPNPVSDAGSASDTPQLVDGLTVAAKALQAAKAHVQEQAKEENTGPAVLEDRPTVESVKAQIGGTVISNAIKEAKPKEAPADFMDGDCSICGKPLKGQNRDFVRLSFIKFRKGYMDDECYAKARAGTL